MKQWRKYKVLGLCIIIFLLVGCSAKQTQNHDVNQDFTYDKLYTSNGVVANSKHSVNVTGYKIVKNVEDMPAIVVYYDYHNKSEEDTTAYDLYMDGYQKSNIPDGSEDLSTAELADNVYSQDEELFDNVYETVKPDGTIKCASSWSLRNNKHAVEIEYYDYDDEYIGMIEINLTKEIVEGSTEL